MTPALRFIVHGTPQPKGSTRALLRQRRDGIVAGVVADNAKTGQWQRAVAWAAKVQTPELWTGPVAVDVTFRLARPVRQSAAARLTTDLAVAVRPDLDKLMRAVLDALTGVCYGDDGQVATVTARKLYAPPGPLAVVVVSRLEASCG
jgi:crossover junction endodeoxyribonuclease RusA